MAWTTPRTWTDGEVVTASIMNAHIRDNENVLKTSIGNDGKFLGLSASTLADLSGTNLTGLVKLAASNTFSSGKHNFNSGSGTRVRIPVGTDKFDGAPGAKTPGSVWTEGNYFHHVASNGNEWRYLGELITSAPSAGQPGSVWFEGGFLHYVDENDNERRLAGTTSGFHSDSSARAGSVWVETYVHWVQESGTTEVQGHVDTHGDSAHVDTHTDSAHTDTHDDVHDDTHTDGHGDGHDDGGSHSDTHTDNHTDTHSDFHGDDGHVDGGHDDALNHDDTHTDSHTDTHDDSHSDVAHNDNHNDTHNDNHSDTHTDNHTDTHTDTHGDAPAQNFHTDAPESVGL